MMANEQSKNQLTVAANKWIISALFDGNKKKDVSSIAKKLPDKCPFFASDGKIYLKYDSIRIENMSKIDGKGLNVNYYWLGVKMAIFPVADITLEMAPGLLADTLNLEGIIGNMEICIG
jgi:hypothetical protein